VSNISVDYDVLNQRGSPAWFSDTFANIPTFGFKGRMFISIDTFAFYRDTGTGWDLIGGPGIGTLTGSGAAGQVSFFNGTQTITGNNNLFWDNTNSRLGIGTITPLGALHLFVSAGTTRMLIDGNAGQNKIITYRTNGLQRFGLYVSNTAESGSNVGSDFQIRAYNDAGTLLTTPFFIKRSSSRVGINNITPSFDLDVAGTFNVSSTAIFGSTLGNGTYTYTLPGATGTLALTSNITSAISGTTNVHAKFTSANVIGNSMVNDDGTTLISAGATRSNFYIKAADNTYYGQLAFTNATNGFFGGISYNNTNQYMQFEASSSELMRLYSTGNLIIGGTFTDAGYKLDVTGTGRFTSTLLVTGAATFSSTIASAGDITITKGSAASFIANNTSVSGKSYRLVSNDSGQFVIQNTGVLDIVNITSGGDVLVGTSSSSFYNGSAIGIGLFGANGFIAASRSSSTCAFFNRFTTTGDIVQIRYAGSNVGSISYNGVNTLYNATSDYRLKEDLQEYNGLEIIKKLKTYNFKWKKAGVRDYGMMAHELQEILPYYVNGQKDEIDENGRIKPQGVDYSKIVPLLVKSIQELNNKLEKNNIN